MVMQAKIRVRYCSEPCTGIVFSLACNIDIYIYIYIYICIYIDRMFEDIQVTVIDKSLKLALRRLNDHGVDRSQEGLGKPKYVCMKRSLATPSPSIANTVETSEKESGLGQSETDGIVATNGGEDGRRLTTFLEKLKYCSYCTDKDC